MTDAPFRQLPGDPLPAAEAFWLTAADDVRLRAACWRAEDGRDAPLHTAPRGTVLLFPGRTEYLEKYAPVAHRLTCAGLHVLGIDWRGQGLSQRLLADPRPGHITDFAHYQRDVDALLDLARRIGLPQPWWLLAHSMGGAIGLRALTRGMAVAAAAFSAPMWGIRMGRMPDPMGLRVGAALSSAAERAGRGGRGTPGPDSVLDVAFSANPLTGDVDAYTRFMREAAAWPDVTLGSASWAWVGAAMAECRALSHLPSPEIPALISLSGADVIVSATAIRSRATLWPSARLLDLPQARHEALFEAPPIRERLLTAILAQFGVAPPLA